MVGVHGHDVVELCNRPIWSDIAFAAVVDPLLSAKPLEEQADRVFLEKARTRKINLVDRDESDLFAAIRLHHVGIHDAPFVVHSKISLLEKNLKNTRLNLHNKCATRMPHPSCKK